MLTSIRSCRFFLNPSILRQCTTNATLGMPTTTTTEPSTLPDNLETSKKGLNKAMKAYLERSKEHDAFMAQQQHDFQIGKRHLANMMGEDPETFTQEDINNAIEYLFPSGLYEKKARPFMLPPEEVFPQRKAAEFDETGRPHHFLFYTSKPNFYKLLYDIVENINELNKFEDMMIRKNLEPDSNLSLSLSGYQWLDKDTLAGKMMENLGDKDYESFTKAMERLCKLPYSYRVKDFILAHCKTLVSQTKTFEIPKPQYSADGRSFITVYECYRKSAKGHVTLRFPGTGKVTINGEDLNYFKDTQPREQILFPLIFTDMLNKIDVEGYVEGGGPSGQAGAIRWGISWGLRSYVDEEMLEKMRLAGLLTRDYRSRERKKPGQAGARKKFTWKKR